MKKIIALCLAISPLLSAEADSRVIQKGGFISSTGVTFASKEAMTEGLARGQYDERNPFVQNVGCIIYSSEKGGFEIATITRIAPEIYLMCKHTLTAFQAAFAKFDQRMECKLQIGKTAFTVLKMMYAMPFSSDPICDAIVVKMMFHKVEGEPLKDDFLPFVQEKLTGSSTAFSVSFAEIFHADPAQPKKAEGERFQRALSVQTVKADEVYLTSLILGTLEQKHTVDMVVAITALQQRAILPEPHDVKSIARKGQYFTPENHRLNATLSYGASGSPLIVKMNGSFFIAGILVLGAPLPNLPNIAAVDKDTIIPLRHEQRFLNLTLYTHAIENAIQELLTNPQYR